MLKHVAFFFQLVLLVGLLTVSSGIRLCAQDAVHFEFSDGIEDPTLKSKMELQISALLTAINRAETNHSDINFSSVNIDERTAQCISRMWNAVRFRIVDNDIVEHCLCVKNGSEEIIGYQVRNIAVEMKPLDDSYAGIMNQEMCINLNPEGVVVDFNNMLRLDWYMKIVREGELLHDSEQRVQILRWVEKFQNAYIQKDIDFMEDFFREDAFFVKEEYMVGKRQYLDNLRKVFSYDGYINVDFDSVEVVRHGAKPNFYAVTLRQRWSSSTYSGEGVVFTIWDFTNEDKPIILVRTWQPRDVGEDKVYKLRNFKL